MILRRTRQDLKHAFFGANGCIIALEAFLSNPPHRETPLKTALLAHIVIPLVAGLGLVLFERASEPTPLSWASCNAIAIDFLLISIGATGALFLNPKLAEKWGAGETAVYAILIVLVNFVLAAVLVYLKRHRKTVGRLAGFVDMFFGVLGLVLTSLLYYWGYQHS